MGILNLTPDSFSGDGLASDLAATIAQIQLFEPEADFLDLGAESTRPNATPVSAEDELSRLLPAIEAARKYSTRLISVDTFKPEVAEDRASGRSAPRQRHYGPDRPGHAQLVAETGVPAIVMHMRGNSANHDEPDRLRRRCGGRPAGMVR